MNRRELVLAITERTELDRKTVDAALAGFVDVVSDSLASGDPVSISGFAKFNRRVRPAGPVRNPFTGETKHQPAKVTVSIRPLKAFKDNVNMTPAARKKAASAKKTAKKAPAKKAAAAKKAPAKKAPAKKAAKKAPAKRR
jgi:DNA-binding protein HU-beta